MPLDRGKGREAFSNNVATEMNAGKPQAQAVAIAYRQAGKDEAMVTTPNSGAPMRAKDDVKHDPSNGQFAGGGGSGGGSNPHAGRSNADLRDDYNKHVGSGNAAGAASVRGEQDRRAGATSASFAARKPAPEKKATEGRSTRARLLRGRDDAMYPDAADATVGEHPARNLDEMPKAGGASGATGTWPGRVL